MTDLAENPLLARLDDARCVLVAGAGGGFDVYAGLPLALALHRRGHEVHLANLTFAAVEGLPLGDWLAPDVARVGPDSAPRQDYFPERALARWLASRDLPWTVHALARVGVQPLRTAYQALIAHLRADAVVLVDGGTDILMRGDEAGLGTPEEDLTSVAALHGLPPTCAPVRLVASIGFGIDAHHGVNHALVLENIAALDRDGAYLGAFSLPRSSPEGAAYLEAVAHAQQETAVHPSIVQGSIAAAVHGKFGDVRFTDRTRGTPLFVNPLMALYFAFELAGLARRCLYLDRIEHTHLMRQTSSAIATFRDELPRTRPPRAFPH